MNSESVRNGFGNGLPAIKLSEFVVDMVAE
jgi:hypothetical protein